MFTPKPQLTLGTSLDGPHPPVVNIPAEVRRSYKVNDAYSKALDQHGPVIMVPRHGRNEYVIDHRYASVLLTDTKRFNFDKAVFDLLHFGFIAVADNGVFVNDIDQAVEGNVQPRMNAIIAKIFPVFRQYFDRMEDEVPKPAETKEYTTINDMFSRMQLAVAHAMVVMVVGEEHAGPELAGHFAAVAVAMARMTGMDESTDEWTWFPKLWVLFNGLSAVFLTIVPRFFFTVAPLLWKTRREHLANGLAARHGIHVPVFDLLLVKHYHEKQGLWALLGFFRCLIIVIGLIFASIHQTVVGGMWQLIKLTEKQDEYLAAIRAEFEAVVPPGELMTVPKLAQLRLLDSFIREVFRTKGDCWGPVRETTQPVRVGPYVIPKGAMCIVLIGRAHQHPDNYGPDGKKFDGTQWVEKGKPASQTSHDYLPFGHGRWACPGRHLAIHEIKIMLYFLFTKFDIKLRANTYRVKNTINTTTVAPEATFLVRRRAEYNGTV